MRAYTDSKGNTYLEDPTMPSAPTRRAGNAPPGSNVHRPLYAIDFTAVACGKRIANTKRRVRWRFGFANPDALAAGETGTACRGEEHDVTLVWSVTSGKRLILADGQEVHYSNSRSAVLDFSWTMRGNHVLKVVAHATAPMSAEPGFRQYDFFVDGRSFFSFPKVYRLGLTGNKTMSRDEHGRGVPAALRSGGREAMAESSGRRKSSSRASGTIAALEAPHNPDEEEAYLREAIKASLESESKRKAGEKTPEKKEAPMSKEATDLLIDFMDDFESTGNTLQPAPAPAAGGDAWAMTAAPVQANNQWAAPAPPDNTWAAAPAPVAPPADAWNQPAPVAQPAPAPTYGGGANAFAAAPANPFAPAPAMDTRASFAQAPQRMDSQRQSFAAAPPAAPVAADPFATSYAQPAPVYGQPAPAADPMAAYGQPAPAQAPVTSDPFAPQPPAPAPAEPAPAPAAPATNGTANNVVLTMGSLTSDGLLAGADAPAQSSGGAGNMADKALQNLMGSIDAFGLQGAAAKPPAANNPFDSSNIMSNATLGEMKNSKSGGDKKSIMNAPPGPGAMVMAGNQGGNWGLQGQQQQQPQYSMAGGYGQPQQQQMGGYGQPQQQQMGGYGQQPQMGQMGMMGQQPQMGMMGQQPPMQQQYGQQPPMQQNQWGAPSY